MRKVKFFIILCACVFMNIFIFSKADCQEIKTVKIYYLPTISHAPAIIADEEGFFKEEGISPEFIKLQNSAEALILLLQGSIDVMQAPPTAGIYNAIKENKTIKFVSGAHYYGDGPVSGGLVIVKGNENLSDKALFVSLKGKKIGLPVLGNFTAYLIENLLRQNGLSNKDFELTVMTFPTVMQSMEKGTLAAGELVEPYITKLKSKIGISFFPYIHGAPHVFVAFGPSIISKDPLLGVKFMSAYLRGCRQFNEGKTARNIAILKKRLGLDEETLRSMSWVNFYPEAILDSKVVRTALNNYQDWLLEKKYIDTKISVDSMLDTSFIEKAKQTASK